LVTVTFILQEFMTSGDKLSLGLRKIFRSHRLICYHSFKLSATTSCSFCASLSRVIAAEIWWSVEFLEGIIVVGLHEDLIVAVKAELAVPAQDLIISEVFLVFGILTIVPNQFLFGVQWLVFVGLCAPAPHLLAD
jgi:hypothetical protein